MSNYLSLNNLDAYIQARKLGEIAWKIYNKFTWEEKKLFGFQFVEATESIAANIAEGYGRFHYLDKVKFYYNSRGSLFESNHWFETIDGKTGKIDNIVKKEYLDCYIKCSITLNGLIKSTMNQKNKIT